MFWQEGQLAFVANYAYEVKVSCGWKVELNAAREIF